MKLSHRRRNTCSFVKITFKVFLLHHSYTAYVNDHSSPSSVPLKERKKEKKKERKIVGRKTRF
jgi:hypothetical protein